MKKLALIVVAALTVFLSGCNTVKGVGQDISAGGQAIDNAAASVQKKL